VPSVLGLLEAKESAARERVERTREDAVRIAAVLEEAERALERLVIAREAVVEVLAEPAAHAVAPVEGVVESVLVAGVGAVPRSTVPYRRGELTSAVLAPDYQRIMSVVEAEAVAGREGIRARALAAALGLEAVPAKIEGVRCKAGRLVERGWLAQHQPGVFSFPSP
jgi:predicted nucleotidyltransferase